MRVQYAVTYEFDTRSPVTHRGTLEARSVGTIAHRAVRLAQKTLRPVNWTTMNFVILERHQDARQSPPEPEIPLSSEGGEKGEG